MYQKEWEAMVSACQKASAEIMNIYRRDFKISTKSDQSPVTEADLASDKIIRKELSVFPEIGWLCEEDFDDKERLSKKAIFVVDPLDGTQDFVNRDGSFGINIALVVNHIPVVSVVGIPAQNAYAYAIKGEGAFYIKEGKKEKLQVSNRTKDLILVESMTHVLDKEKEIERKHKDLIQKVIHMGASTKMIALGQQKADCSVRYTDKTKEWDTCAPELLVTEAGGVFLDTELKPFVYNREDVYNRKGYCMFNRIENKILLS